MSGYPDRALDFCGETLRVIVVDGQSWFPWNDTWYAIRRLHGGGRRGLPLGKDEALAILRDDDSKARIVRRNGAGQGAWSVSMDALRWYVGRVCGNAKTNTLRDWLAATEAQSSSPPPQKPPEAHADRHETSVAAPPPSTEAAAPFRIGPMAGGGYAVTFAPRGTMSSDDAYRIVMESLRDIIAALPEERGSPPNKDTINIGGAKLRDALCAEIGIKNLKDAGVGGMFDFCLWAAGSPHHYAEMAAAALRLATLDAAPVYSAAGGDRHPSKGHHGQQQLLDAVQFA